MNTPLRVLIIGDSENDVKLLMDELRYEGFEPTYMRVDTEAALSGAFGSSAWDVVLCDDNVPQFDPFAALTIVKAANVDLPFIVLSRVMRTEVAVALMKAGAHDYLPKDNLARLIPVIRCEIQEAGERHRRRQAERVLRKAYNELEARVIAHTAELQRLKDSLQAEITERIRAEHTVQAYEEQYQQLLEGSIQSLLIHQDGLIQCANTALAHTFGYESAEELIGQDFRKLLSPREHVHLETYCTARRGGKSPPLRYEFQGLKKDGTLLWLECLVMLVWWRGKFAIQATLIEITERKLAEETLRKAEEKYRTVVENAHDAIVILQNGQAVYRNPAYKRLLGYKGTEIAGHNFLDLVVPEQRGQVQEWYFQRFKDQPAPEQYEVALIPRDGFQVTMEVKPRRIDYQGQPATLVVMHNITEHKQVEAHLQASLAEKDVLLRETHHRVKNNLQIIASLLALQAGQLKEPQKRSLFRDSQLRVHALGLVHETLYQAQNLARVDFGNYLKRLTAALYHAYGIDAAVIALTLHVDQVTLSLDTAIPCALIVNELVSNSLKHAFPDGMAGAITITLQAAPGQQCHLMVADTGCGLPCARVSDQPTSLGLRIVAALTQQIQGNVAWETTHGTACTLTFPLSSEV